MDHPSRQRDRRAFGRRRSCIHATILIPGRPPAHCIVRNYSSTGALLEVLELVEPHQVFKLRIDRTGDEIECELRHRKLDRIGVKFATKKVGDILERAFAEKLPRPQRRLDIATVAAEKVSRVTLRELREYLPESDD